MHVHPDGMTALRGLHVLAQCCAKKPSLFLPHSHQLHTLAAAAMAKAKATKHTAGEIAAKAKAALQNKGGGNAGKADRQGGKVGHAKYKCFVCQVQVRLAVVIFLECSPPLTTALVPAAGFLTLALFGFAATIQLTTLGSGPAGQACIRDWQKFLGFLRADWAHGSQMLQHGSAAAPAQSVAMAMLRQHACRAPRRLICPAEIDMLPKMRRSPFCFLLPPPRRCQT